MKKPTFIFFNFLATALLLVQANLSWAADLEDAQQLGAFIDGVVQPLMKNYESASGVVVIVRGDEVVLAKGYGYQDFAERIPVDPDRTIFRTGSISKLFTWISVMQLVEQGTLDLDVDVNEYLNNFQIDDTFEQAITLRHILTHTTGFEEGSMGYLVVANEGDLLPLGDAMERYQQVRVNPPGVQVSYSNYATSVAGLIVANVSGLSFNDYIQQNIFDVLGMENSTFAEPLPDHLLDQQAKGYQPGLGTYEDKPLPLIGNFGPAGALSSTGADMARFALAIMNDGEQILRAETMRQMLTRSFSQDDRMMGMALGFYETEHNGVRLIGHAGDMHNFHSDLAIDLGNDLAIYSSFSAIGGATVRSSIVPAFYDEFFPLSEASPVPPPGFSERALKYAGTYKFWRSSFSTIERILSIGGVTVIPTKDDTLLLVLGDSAKEYVEIDDNLFRERDKDFGGYSSRLVSFQENAQGEIKGMLVDGLPFMSMYKSPFYSNLEFNLLFFGLAIFVFVGVLLRLAYQWSRFKAMNGGDRSATLASVYVASSNLAFIVVASTVIAVYGIEIFFGIPFAFKAMLVLPIIATLAGFYHFYRAVTVWKGGLFGGVWAKLRYSIVTFCALFMCWFYFYWNILGFQYYS